MIKELTPSQKQDLAGQFGYLSWARYAARAGFLFQGLDLRGKRVCDVGCGSGTWTVWCALQGASCFGLEPQAEGSTAGRFSLSRRIVESYGLRAAVSLSQATMEGFLAANKGFDVIVLYNVINHVDEDAVQRLHHDEAARAKFREKFCLLRSALSPGGTLIVADCGRTNFWNQLGLESPVAPTIEWDKHQDPGLWSALARETGFTVKDLRWSYSYPLTSVTANRLAAYFLASHFVLRLVPK